ncbi:hypothetical protein I4U23_015069 [Adineta vaga]|nr:hypothetical protein I4U23_015069 [Adineta vaga]
MFSHMKSDDQDKKRSEIMGHIKTVYETNVRHNVERVEQRNVLLIGRARTGKSTIKDVLVDPTMISDYMIMASHTKLATFESFIIQSNNMLINIIDTPGLFERGTEENIVRDNKTILRTIEQCVEREITKFHLVDFCASFECGINTEDIVAIRELTHFLGAGVTQNSCLIITRCESKDSRQRERLIEDVVNNIHFKPLASYFKKGIFFSVCLNRDSWDNATDDLYNQFDTIVSYREKFIDLLTNNIEPFMVQESAISRLRQLVNEQAELKKTTENLEKKGQKDEALIRNYQQKFAVHSCNIQ